jgi:basic membrane protein A
MLSFFIFLAVYLTNVNSLKVAFILPGCTSDLGWNFQILKGILLVKEQYPDVVVVYQESVTPSNCEVVATTIANDGADLIYFASGSFDPCARAVAGTFLGNTAKSFVVQNSGIKYADRPNLAIDAKSGVFQARFVIGALLQEQSVVQNKVCFMYPINYGSGKRWANAILNGMSYPNIDTAELLVGYTNDFNHPPSEAKVFNYFLGMGCNFIIQHQDSIYPQLLAARAGIQSIGWGTDQRLLVGENVLTSIVTNWFPVFSYYLEKKIAEAFVSEIFTETLANGALQIAQFSSEVKNRASSHAEEVYEGLLSGSISPFCGSPVQEKFGTPCTTESTLIAEFLPHITVYDGTVV